MQKWKQHSPKQSIYKIPTTSTVPTKISWHNENLKSHESNFSFPTYFSWTLTDFNPMRPTCYMSKIIIRRFCKNPKVVKTLKHVNHEWNRLVVKTKNVVRVRWKQRSPVKQFKKCFILEIKMAAIEKIIEKMYFLKRKLKGFPGFYLFLSNTKSYITKC